MTYRPHARRDSDPHASNRRSGVRTLRASTPADLLATVPYLLGFHPDQSIVVVTLGQAESPVHARLDLPHDLDEVPAVVVELVAIIRRAGVDRIALVLYTDDEGVAAAVAHPLLAAFEGAGIAVPAAVRADGERWHCLGETGGGCSGACPVDGTPYDLATHPLTTEALVEGRVVLPSRDALHDSLIGDDPDEIDRVCEAVETAEGRLRAASRSPLGPPDPAGGRRHLISEGRWVQHRLRRFVGDRHRLDSHDVGRLVVALASTEVRDVAWAELRRGTAPSFVDLWRDIVRRTPVESRAAPAGLLAFAAWLAGNGSLAWCALDVCQEAQPGYSMAAVLDSLLRSGMPPQRWRPLPQEALSLFA